MTTKDLDAAHSDREEAFALLTVIARWKRLGLGCSWCAWRQYASDDI